jgi:hypothetical protein
MEETLEVLWTIPESLIWDGSELSWSAYLYSIHHCWCTAPYRLICRCIIPTTMHEEHTVSKLYIFFSPRKSNPQLSALAVMYYVESSLALHTGFTNKTLSPSEQSWSLNAILYLKFLELHDRIQARWITIEFWLVLMLFIPIHCVLISAAKCTLIPFRRAPIF